MKPQALARLRLAAQHVEGSRAGATPVETVRSMLAMQAQDFAAAKWAIGLRTRGATNATFDAAIEAGSIVRSWPMRGTLHLTAIEDLPWMLALTTRRMLSSTAGRLKRLDLDTKDLERTRTVALMTLTGGKRLARNELLKTFERHGIATTGQRGPHVLWYLAQTGTLCFGPHAGKEPTFVLLDEQLARAKVRARHLEQDEALGEIARRYFRGHGPASMQDLTVWAKLSLGEARIGLAVARSELTALDVEGVTYWMAKDAAPPTSGDDRVHLLPAFDEYALGYRDRSAVLQAEHKTRIVPGGNGMFLPMVVVGGQIVGTWRRTVKRREIIVEATAFTRWTSKVVAGIAGAATTYGQFNDCPARLV